MKTVKQDELNWPQRSAFFPSTFGLVLTTDGHKHHVSPYQLVYPFNIGPEQQSLIMHTKPFGDTRTNLHMTKQATITYGKWHPEQLKAIARIGDHRVVLNSDERLDLLASAGIELVTPEDGNVYLDTVEFNEIWHAYQVFDVSVGTEQPLPGGQMTQLLKVDRIRIREQYVPGLEGDGPVPNAPVFYGYRRNAGFVFAWTHDAWAVEPQLDGWAVETKSLDKPE